MFIPKGVSLQLCIHEKYDFNAWSSEIVSMTQQNKAELVPTSPHPHFKNSQPKFG
jgi:hypothetical protein